MGLGAIAFVILLPGPALAQENETCLMCHGSREVFRDVPNGARLVVDQAAFGRSVHGAAGLTCATCHQVGDLPHPDSLPRVDCSACHETQVKQHAESVHGRALARGDPLAPKCTDCHGTHNIQSHTDLSSRTAVVNVPFLCGSCHHEGSPVSRARAIPQDSILENYSNSQHGAGLLQAGLTVTAVCTSCHTAHDILPHTDPRSTINRNNVAKTCTQCHAQIERVHRKVIEGRLWESAPHRLPACVDCHAPHVIRQVFYETGAANQDCLTCHGKPDLRGAAHGERNVSLYVDEKAYNTSMHRQTGCAQCHTEVTASLTRPCSTIRSKVDCAPCHGPVVAQYDSSRHGTLALRGDPDAPACGDCHAKHREAGHLTPGSPTFVSNIPDLCARCHRQGEKAAKRIAAKDSGLVQSYEESIHGKGLLESGLLVTATCTSCHTAHGELPPSDPRSTVYPDNVAGTCGNCHHGIEQQFRASIHAPGVGRPRGDIPLPTCKDCHTSHTISRTDLANFRLRMMDQCGRCHQPEATTFFDTFHGKVSRLGDLGAAKCYDCHGTHNILPISNVRSTLSRRNIQTTCSQCHTGVNRRFVGYLTHATHHEPARYPYLFWTFWAMTGLLVGTLTFATGHTLAWLWRLWRTPELRPHRHASRSGKRYQRFTNFARKLHLVMLLAFFTLALTGMVLKFSYMGWAQGLSARLGGFSTTGVLHRVAALTLITVFLTHLADVWRRKKRSGKTWLQVITGPDSLVFNWRDAREFWQSIKWFFGKGPRPRYGRYTYWEKFDYFAVFWGMLIIGTTGLLLWFPEVFTLILPGWTVNVATILHSDEALLAVAFIFTVHFFNTHFRPDKFPMDPVIFTGQVPLEELERDKPREYEELVRDGTLEQHLVDPYPWKIERWFRIFAYGALAVGLTLIALIVYSMLFGYR
jgi:cytochrome b subunit of formate dehydrogenase